MKPIPKEKVSQFISFEWLFLLSICILFAFGYLKFHFTVLFFDMIFAYKTKQSLRFNHMIAVLKSDLLLDHAGKHVCYAKYLWRGETSRTIEEQ